MNLKTIAELAIARVNARIDPGCSKAILYAFLDQPWEEKGTWYRSAMIEGHPGCVFRIDVAGAKRYRLVRLFVNPEQTAGETRWSKDYEDPTVLLVDLALYLADHLRFCLVHQH